MSLLPIQQLITWEEKTKSKCLMKILRELIFEILCTMSNININRLAEKVCKM